MVDPIAIQVHVVWIICCVSSCLFQDLYDNGVKQNVHWKVTPRSDSVLSTEAVLDRLLEAVSDESLSYILFLPRLEVPQIEADDYTLLHELSLLIDGALNGVLPRVGVGGAESP